MRIEDHEFVPVAQQIPEGQKRKVEHCGLDASMIVSHEAQRYRAYCFRCHGVGFADKPRDFAQIMASLRAAQDADQQAARSISLPADCKPSTSDWPAWARVWLHKAGLSRADIEGLGLLYSPSMARVVIPVRDSQGQVVFWQARGNNRMPKYLSPEGVDRRKLIPRYGRPTGVVALTEDLLSAMKIGYVTEAWSCMGTVMHDALLVEILQRKLRVLVALDPDAAGIAAATDITNRLRAYDVPVVNVVSRLRADPKLMSRAEIADILKEVVNVDWQLGPDTHQVPQAQG